MIKIDIKMKTIHICIIYGSGGRIFVEDKHDYSM